MTVRAGGGAFVLMLTALLCACGGGKKPSDEGAVATAGSQSAPTTLPAREPVASTPRGLVVEINAMAREVHYAPDRDRSGATRETSAMMIALDEPRGLVRVMTSSTSYSAPEGGSFTGGGLAGAIVEIPFGAAKASFDKKTLGKTQTGEAVKSVTFSCKGRKPCISVSTGGAFSPSAAVDRHSVVCLESVCPDLAEKLDVLLDR